MDEEIKNLLEKNLEVSEKSLAILQKMRRGVIWGRIFHLAKWVIIIGLLIFGFIKVQPYILYWSEVFADISAGLQSVNNFFQR